MLYLLTVTTLLAFTDTLAPPAAALLPASRHKPLVIAHRGDHTVAPENTLAAYESAIRNGADYVEVDLRTTADGKLVVMHNATVNHMTNGSGEVKALGYDRIRQLKVMDKAHPEKGTYRVPAFEEVLALCRNRIGIYLDFKDADAAATYALIKQARMENAVIVYINEEAQFHEWRRVAPHMQLMTSLPGYVTDTATLRRFLDACPVSALDGETGRYTPEMRRMARERGVAIWLDVQAKQEGPAQWEPALREEVDGLQTDHPALLLKYLRQRGYRTTAGK